MKRVPDRQTGLLNRETLSQKKKKKQRKEVEGRKLILKGAANDPIIRTPQRINQKRKKVESKMLSFFFRFYFKRSRY